MIRFKHTENDYSKYLEKYKNETACLMNYSNGYFGPKAALLAIIADKNKEPFFCEWYFRIGIEEKMANFPKINLREATKDETWQQLMKEINHRVIRQSKKAAKNENHEEYIKKVEKYIIKKCA